MSRLKTCCSIFRITVRELVILNIMIFVKILLFLKLSSLVEKCCELLVHVWPSRKAEIFSHFAWAYERSGNIEKAIICFQNASNIEPNNAMYYFDLGTLFEKKRNIPSAIDHYKKALNFGKDFSIEFKSQLQSKIEEIKP